MSIRLNWMMISITQRTFGICMVRTAMPFLVALRIMILSMLARVAR